MAMIITSFIFRFVLFVFCALLSTKGWWLWWWRWPSSTWIVASPDSNFISKPRCCCRRVNEIIQIVQTRFNLSSFISQIICKCFLEFCEKKYSFSANTLVYARFGLLSCFCFEKKNIAKILAEVIPPSPVSYLYRTKKSLSLPDHILQQGGVGSSHYCHLLPLGSRTQPTPICFATHLYSTFTIMLLFFNMALNGKNWA